MYMIPMESSVVIVVGITVTLSSLLVKFQVRLTELDCAVELSAIIHTRSCGSPTTPCCKLYGLKKVLGVGAICTHVQKAIGIRIYSGACLIDLYTFNLPISVFVA